MNDCTPAQNVYNHDAESILCTLPNTGIDATTLLAVGVILVIIGLVGLYLTRERRA